MKKLIEIQKELKVAKNQYNDFGKYKYRSCEDILEAVKPLLGEAILTLNDEMVMLGERYYIKSVAKLKEGDESESVTAYAREASTKKGMDEAQITGSASSYARKYALSGLFLLDDNKDSDKQENKVDIEKIKKELSKITDIGVLREYYSNNSGLGKEVSEMITKRSKELENENTKK